MKIREVEATWLRVPLPAAKQHVSDFGRIEAFDGVLVTIRSDGGLVGHGEAKAGVGSAGDCAALTTILTREFAPRLIGADAREITRIGQSLSNGVRAQLAERCARTMPILGRRGVHAAAIAGVDLALWDLAGKAHGCSVLELVGGKCRDRVRAYASGGWADAAGIGAQSAGYVAQGFRAVKMRVGAMDGGVAASVARVRAARAALGPDVELMVDAHGTMSVPEAKAFCAALADCGLRFVEEPVASADREGLAEVRAASAMPIAAGESECTLQDFAELVGRRAVDVLQPDLAIASGFSAGLSIAALAAAHRLELAPHCWGSALSFRAGLTLAFASPSGAWMEVPMGGAPLLRELAPLDLALTDGGLEPPAGPGWGVEPDPEFVARWTQR